MVGKLGRKGIKTGVVVELGWGDDKSGAKRS